MLQVDIKCITPEQSSLQLSENVFKCILKANVVSLNNIVPNFIRKYLIYNGISVTNWCIDIFLMHCGIS